MVNYKIVFVFLKIFILVALSLALPSLKIYGGEDARITDFPYMVFLRDKYQSFCGGAIINANTVLTSAQCTMNFKSSSEIRVGYGSVSISKASYTNVTEIIQHENFQMDPPWIDDIAVLKVNPPIIFSDVAQPIDLPLVNEATPAGQLAIFTGWGETEITVNQDILQKINMTIFNDTQCENDWINTYSPVNSAQKLCAESDMSDGVSRGQCYGDTGGPLVVDGVLYGVASYFYRTCGRSNLPPVFTKIAAYIEWISEKL